MSTDPLMKQTMILGVESFKGWLGKKYLFSELNYIEVNTDIEAWIKEEFDEQEYIEMRLDMIRDIMYEIEEYIKSRRVTV